MRVMQEETFGPVLPVAVVAVDCAALVKRRGRIYLDAFVPLSTFDSAEMRTLALSHAPARLN